MSKIKNEHLLPVEIWRIYPFDDVTPPESFLVVLKGEEDKFEAYFSPEPGEGN